MGFTKQDTQREIREFSIDINNLETYFNSITKQESLRGENYPIVYLLHNDTNKELYIGESTSAVRRMREHFDKTNKNYSARAKLNVAHIIFDDTFNKSAILDIEQELIHMFSVDSSKYTLQNRNDGQSCLHQYYNRDYYQNSLREIWDELHSKIHLVNDSYEDVLNNNIFKYSPYVSLTQEQQDVCYGIVDELLNAIKNNCKYNAVIQGLAGTGKTVVLIKALALLKQVEQLAKQSPNNINNTNLFDDEEDLTAEQILSRQKMDALVRKYNLLQRNQNLKIAYVVPLSELIDEFRIVFKAAINNSSVVCTATEVAKSSTQYDIIFVDESHRLGTINKFGVDKTPYKVACNAVGMTYQQRMKNPPTELDWILQKSNCNVFVYDENQKVRGHQSILTQQFETKVLNQDFTKKKPLTKQMRCKAGEKYLRFLSDLFDNQIDKETPLPPYKGYDFRIYEDINDMAQDIFQKNNTVGLSRLTAGYGWEWKTKGMKRTNIMSLAQKQWDIDIKGTCFFWNVDNFIFNAANDKQRELEIGCVHTVQGFDLNYVGVIFGPEIDYDSQNGFYISEPTYDNGVKVADKIEKLELVLRAYKVLMQRGIRGCYVYAVNKGIREYLSKYIPTNTEAIKNVDAEIIGVENPIVGLNVSAPKEWLDNTCTSIKLKKDDLYRKIDSHSLNELKVMTINSEFKFNIVNFDESSDNEYVIFSISQK